MAGQSHDDEVFGGWLMTWLASGMGLVLALLILFAAMGVGYWSGLIEAGWAVCPSLSR